MSNKRRKEKKSRKLREKYYEERIPSMRGAGASMGKTIGGIVATDLRYIRGAFKRKQTRP